MKHIVPAFSAQLFYSKILLVVLLVVVLLLAFLSPVFAQGQETTDTTQTTAPLMCVDVLPSGGVQVTAPDTTELTLAAGEEMSVPVTIDNVFPYELRGLGVFVAVYHNDDIVPFDWFMVAPDRSIATNGQLMEQVVWTIPASAPAGTYTAAVFVEQATEQQFLAKSLGRFAAKATLPFTVTEGNTPATTFDRASFTLNDEAINPAGVVSFAEDATTLALEFVLENTYTDKPVIGSLQLDVYEGFYPHELQLVSSEVSEARLISGTRADQAVLIETTSEQYLVVGRFVAEDGTRSSFVIPLERTGTQMSMQEPIPRITHLGVVTNDGATAGIGCIGFRPLTIGNAEAGPYQFDITYRLSIHPIDENGEPVRSEALVSVEGLVPVSNLTNADVAFRQQLDTDATEYLLRLEVLKGDTVVDVRETRYNCSSPFGCSTAPVGYTGSSATIFGISVSSLILGMQLATLAIILLVLSIFFGNIWPLIRRTLKKGSDDTTVTK